MNDFERLFDVSGLSLDRLRTFLRVVEAGNLSKAASGDATRQSQFSRQIKEMESFFGVAQTRRVGRRIEITDEGKRLGLIIRRQFREIDDFRESMADRRVSVRIGSQGSVIDWLLIPRLADIQKTLALEPRHFGALSGLGLIFMATGDPDAALRSFEAVLTIYPLSRSARQQVETVPYSRFEQYLAEAHLDVGGPAVSNARTHPIDRRRCTTVSSTCV